MEIVHAQDLQDLYGPVEINGVDFYTDKKELAELLDEDPPPNGDYSSLLDQEVPGFSFWFGNLSMSIQMKVAEWADMNDGNVEASCWACYRSGVLIGCVEGYVVMHRMLHPEPDGRMPPVIAVQYLNSSSGGSMVEKYG